jgi:hypothetical protein
MEKNIDHELGVERRLVFLSILFLVSGIIFLILKICIDYVVIMGLYL